MDIIKYDVYRGPNIGVYISVNDTIGLVPMGFAETKAKKDTDLGLYERLKIKCGQRHFQVLGIPFEVVKTISDLEHQEFTKNG